MNEKLLFLQDLLEDPEEFYSQIYCFNQMQKFEFAQLISVALLDLKRFFRLSLRFKELLFLTHEITQSLTFNDAF
jgi:hypothetical protein